jgi:O-Antigen ligase
MSVRRASERWRVGAAAGAALVVAAPALAGGGLELPFRQQGWLIVWWVLALGLAFGVAPRALPPRGWRLAAAGLAGLAALQLASAVWGPSTDRALADACRSIGYLGVLALAWGFLGPRSWRSAATALFIVAAGVTAYAVLGRLAPGLPGLDDPLANASGRLSEPLGYWNALGAWAAMTAAAALAWSVDARDLVVRQAAAAILPMAGSAVYLTYSRGSVLATAVGLLAVVALTRNPLRAALHAAAGAAATAFCIVAIEAQPEIANGTGDDGALAVGVSIVLASGACWLVARASRRLPREDGAQRARGPRWALGGAAALAIVLAAVAIVAGRDGFGRGGDGATFVENPSARLTAAGGNRSALWSEALDGFAARPVQGEGAGSFGYRWAREGSESEQVADPHSLPFATATELGVLGLLALGAALIGVAATIRRALGTAGAGHAAIGLTAAVCAFVVSALVDWTWDSTALATLAVASAGVVGMAASRRADPDAAGGRERRTILPPAARWAAFAVALALGAMQVPGAVSAQFVADSREQLRLGNPGAAVDLAADALTATPWSAAAHAARAEAVLGLGRPDEARAAAEQAIEAEPESAQHRILLALIDAERDDLTATTAALADAVALSPHEPRLGSIEVKEIGERLERNGFDELDILGSADPRQ